MKKGLIVIGLLSIATPSMSNTLVGVLLSKETENTTIDGREFEGDNIASLLVAGKLSDSFGGYLSVGGTFGRTEETREKDEKNNEFKNDISYRVFNLGLTYSPISHVTFLGGAGYAQSEGKYYTSKYDTVRTKKDRGVNYSGGLNLTYDNFGIIAMYDSYPKVFSFGISYKYGSVTKKRNKVRSTRSIHSYEDKYISNPNYSDAFNRAKRKSDMMRTLDSSPTKALDNPNSYYKPTVEEATCNELMRKAYFKLSACKMVKGNVPGIDRNSCKEAEKARKAASLIIEKEITDIPYLKTREGISGVGFNGIQKVFDEAIPKPSFCK